MRDDRSSAGEGGQPSDVIDTHCHLLPGLDDGPRSLGESVMMARRLTRSGVVHTICTPHASPRYPLSQRRAASAMQHLQTALDELEIPLGLSLAAEVHPRTALRAPLDDLLTWSIGRRFVIVELVRSTTAAEVERVLARLAEVGTKPIFAHPERCHAVQSGSDVIEQVRMEGALIQVVAPSLTGAAASAVGRVAWELLAQGQVDMVASDGHTAESSRLNMDALADVVAARLGVATARRLFVECPRQVVDASGYSGAW